MAPFVKTLPDHVVDGTPFIELRFELSTCFREHGDTEARPKDSRKVALPPTGDVDTAIEACASTHGRIAAEHRLASTLAKIWMVQYVSMRGHTVTVGVVNQTNQHRLNDTRTLVRLVIGGYLLENTPPGYVPIQARNKNNKATSIES